MKIPLWKVFATLAVASLVSTAALAAAPRAQVTVAGSMTETLDAFHHAKVTANAKTQEYRIELLSDASANLAARRPFRQTIVFRVPVHLKPGTYAVHGLVLGGQHIDRARSPVVVWFICDSLHEKRFPKCDFYNGRATGTLTLNRIGKTFAGKFRFTVQRRANRPDKVTIHGSFLGIPFHS